MIGRHLDWEGCRNVRDLGGLPAAGGRVTRWGAVVRSDAPDNLSPDGWAALRAHGIRTIVDLRNHDEHTGPPGAGAAGVATVHVPMDDVDDTRFWREMWDGGLDGTPLYYRPFLERKPERCVAAVAAVADAPPGGVLVHCGIGRDRTGLVALLLLALVGVAPDDIAEDYDLSSLRLGTGAAAALVRRDTTARAVVMATLAAVDVVAVLRAAGLTDRRLRAVRDRLLEPPGPPPAATRRGPRSGPSGR